jgi:hypothetical protein
LQQLENVVGGVFMRGLRRLRDLKVPAVACVFSSVLRTGSVQDTDFTIEEIAARFSYVLAKVGFTPTTSTTKPTTSSRRRFIAGT